MPTLSSLEHINKVLSKTFPRVEHLCRESDWLQGIKTGFKDLDNLTAGLQPATLTVIGARPGMGKTALLLTILHNMAFNSECSTNKAIAFFSPETPAQLLTERLLCLDANIYIGKLHNGELREAEWKALWKSCERLKSSNLYINDTNLLTTNAIRTQLQILAKSQFIDVIAIDSLQSLVASAPKANRNDELEEIARDLKAISIEFNVPIIVTSQLNRSLEDRHFKEPLLSDVGTSNHIVNVADLVLLLYREDYYSSNTENQNIAELKLAKHRFWPTTTIFLFFQKETGKFRCLSFDKNR
jgi:replicative DNA helicase